MPLSYGSTIVFQVPSRLIVFLLAGSAMTGFAEICANRVVLTKRTTPASSRILASCFSGTRGRKYKSERGRELSHQPLSLVTFGKRFGDTQSSLRVIAVYRHPLPF